MKKKLFVLILSLILVLTSFSICFADSRYIPCDYIVIPFNTRFSLGYNTFGRFVIKGQFIEPATDGNNFILFNSVYEGCYFALFSGSSLGVSKNVSTANVINYRTDFDADLTFRSNGVTGIVNGSNISLTRNLTMYGTWGLNHSSDSYTCKFRFDCLDIYDLDDNLVSSFKPYFDTDTDTYVLYDSVKDKYTSATGNVSLITGQLSGTRGFFTQFTNSISFALTSIKSICSSIVSSTPLTFIVFMSCLLFGVRLFKLLF